jgi:hypothetical protein
VEVALQSFRLILEGDPPEGGWLLEWDDETLSLRDPEGRPIFEAPSASAHRVVDLDELYGESKVGFATPFGSWAFRKYPDALEAVRQLVERGLAGDPAFLLGMRAQALRMAALGLVMFAVGGGLFGLYCWFASWAPTRPRDTGYAGSAG